MSYDSLSDRIVTCLFTCVSYLVCMIKVSSLGGNENGDFKM